MGEHHVRPVADPNPVEHVDPAFRQGVDLAEKRNRIDHDTRSDHAERPFVKHAGGEQVQGERVATDTDGVPGIGTAVEPHDEVVSGAEQVHDLALALVTPGEAEHAGMLSAGSRSQALLRRAGQTKRGPDGPNIRYEQDLPYASVAG